MLGDLADAAKCFQEAVRLRSPYPEAEFALNVCLGLIYKDQNNYQQSEKHLRAALEKKPGDVQVLISLADTLRFQKRFDEAERFVQDVIDRHPSIAEAHAVLGTVYSDQGRTEKAIPRLREALALRPDLVIALDKLGVQLAATGEIEEARQCYRRALAIDPQNASIFYNLSLIERIPDDDPLLQTMEDLLHREETSSEDRMRLYFAFGRIRDSRKQYDTAFELWIEGNRIKRRTLTHSMEAERNFAARLRSVFTDEFMEARIGVGCPSRVPIFIVGMPRSGTTLVEQILAAHPQVYGAGELPNLNRMVNTTLKRLTGHDYPESVTAMTSDQFRQAGEEYDGTVRTLDTGAHRITDKMPVNFFHVGLAKLVLPQSKIIHCSRNALDTCVSCFSTLFMRASCPFAYDMRELGEFYSLYAELMEHWRKLAHVDFLDVHYETLVADQERVTRDLLSFCELPWDDSCLDFHRCRRPVHTASNVQIRQPMYSHAVERWRRYEKHLGPLREALGDLDTST